MLCDQSAAKRAAKTLPMALPAGCTMHPSIDVVDTAHGRGLRAARPIKAGEVLLLSLIHI